MSTAIGIRFPGGRYHATPWDRHVNEADVEWPPSPLRILRALIAVWHRKADHAHFSEDEVRRLIHAMAAESPVYCLPAGTLAHTRHYMPTRSGTAEKPTLVFDAFLRVDPDEELIAVWPDTDLGRAESELLDHLLARLGYLGRAESWAEARRLERWSAPPDCGPQDTVERWGGSTLGATEPVSLPGSMSATAYVKWREDQIRDLGLERPRRVRERALRATLPDELVDALRLETGESRGVGWSRMPGTVEITYLRPAGCLTVTPAAPRTRKEDTRVEITTARLALIRTPKGGNGAEAPRSAPLPPLEDALRVGEVCRTAAMYHAGEAPPVLSGHDLPDDAVHQHAFYLPEDADGDGRIDHVTVHAFSGLGGDAVRALSRLERLWVDAGAEWCVLLEGFGTASDFPDHPYLGTARTWESVTPYLHPWFRKRSFAIEDQVRRELQGRGYPPPETQSLRTVRVGNADRRPIDFHRFRTRRGLVQPDTQGSFWRLTFPEPVPGPIALGFGCHYGLGIFRPVASADG